MMRALRLDYRADGRNQKRLGFLSLLLAVLFAASLAWYFNALRQQQSHLEDLMDRLDSRIHGSLAASKSAPKDPQKFAEVVKFSNHVIHQLNLPWDGLFAELEKAKGEQVALLGLEPDARSPVIKIMGEARDYAAMVDYVRGLSEEGALQGVYLIDHKMDDQNPDHPIRFTLEASWAAKSP